MIKKELRIFFTALMFYTRIPCPKWVDHSASYLNQSTRYFPLIGWIVGLLCFAVYYGASCLFPADISVIISIITGIFVTGAFHEDGFADVCDGFGGGWTKQKILDIMKDSRVGAFGVIGLVLLFLLKFGLLLHIVQIGNITPAILLALFIAAHSLSRMAAISMVFTHQYAREDDSSKAKPVAQSYTWKEVSGVFIFGSVPLIFLSLRHYQILYALIPVFIVRLLLGRYFKKWIGGYTGDCMGATQQICETVFYLSIIGIWKFI